MLFICQWLLFVKVMQSPHDMKWNVNFVWGTHRYAQKEGGRAAGFTFTITVMIQSSLIIIPLPSMSAVIEKALHTAYQAAVWQSWHCASVPVIYTEQSIPLCLSLVLFPCTSNSYCLPLLVSVQL